MRTGGAPYDTQPSLRHRRGLLRALLVFTIVFGALFVPVNFYAGKYLLAATELAVVAVAALLMPVAARTAYLRRWSLFYVLLLYSATMFAFASPQTSITVFAWIMVMPILAHLLLGRRIGGAIALFYLLLSAAIFVWRFDAGPVFDSGGSVLNIVTVTASSFIFSHVYEASREAAERQLSAMALTDALTGLANRSRLHQRFEQALAREELPLALVMIDLDHFKDINDGHGHNAGDAVLRYIADTMRSQIRATDLAVRLGGEEFCLMLPATDHALAKQLGERVRRAIEARQCRHRDTELRVTASVGVASAAEPNAGLHTLLHRADRRLYRAKAEGRNRVVA